MSKESDLLESLLSQAQNLPHRDDSAVDSLRRRTEMAIRRIYGPSSPHLLSLRYIHFYPLYANAGDTSKNNSWTEGQKLAINLIRTMNEEWSLFESDPTPVLVINDDTLRQRTSDLLSAPDNFDRVLREATTILEDRIRRKVPFDDLAKLIPNASDQTGDSLVNKLLNPSSPIIVFGDRHEQTRLSRMLGGVIAYLRNPSHHSVDDNVQWSWAWSAVGLIDQLLGDLESATYQRPPNL